jgi:hypothetical protein
MGQVIPYQVVRTHKASKPGRIVDLMCLLMQFGVRERCGSGWSSGDLEAAGIRGWPVGRSAVVTEEEGGGGGARELPGGHEGVIR